MADENENTGTPVEGQAGEGASTAGEGAQAQTAGEDGQSQGESGQLSENARSTLSALAGLEEGSNTFDQGESASSLFNESGQQGAESGNSEGDQGGQQGQNGVQSTEGGESGEPGSESQASPGENEAGAGSQEQSGQQQGEQEGISSQLFEEIEDGSGGENTDDAFTFESAEDFEKFFQSTESGITKENIATKLPELLDTSKKFDEVTKKSQGYEAVFNNMPKPIYEAIMAWDKGEDWRQPVLNHDPTDYSQEFGKQDAKAMVEKFFPGKVSAEDWEEYKDSDGDQETKDKIDSYLTLTEEKYNLTKQQHAEQIKNYEQQAQQNLEKAQASFDTSRTNIFKAFEGTPLKGVKESAVVEIDKSLANQRAILLEFLNEDGTFKPDAHEKMAMLKFGKDLVVQQAKAIQKQAVSDARAEVISGTADQAGIQKSGDKTTPNERELMAEKARKQAEDLLGSPNENLF